MVKANWIRCQKAGSKAEFMPSLHSPPGKRSTSNDKEAPTIRPAFLMIKKDVLPQKDRPLKTAHLLSGHGPDLARGNQPQPFPFLQVTIPRRPRRPVGKAGKDQTARPLNQHRDFQAQPGPVTPRQSPGWDVPRSPPLIPPRSRAAGRRDERATTHVGIPASRRGPKPGHDCPR